VERGQTVRRIYFRPDAKILLPRTASTIGGCAMLLLLHRAAVAYSVCPIPSISHHPILPTV
jgi:hypothetical protein